MKSNTNDHWRSVRLGDVAIERTERVENPADSGYDRYVGSDDMDRFDLSIRRWRPVSDVTSAAKVFYPGDYLFVRRSLYASDFRERAAMANFTGICSGDILPLRERPGAIEPGYLGIVLTQPAIWDHVVKCATGSITRRIKWRDLAAYKFDLPPAELQRVMVSRFAAANEVAEAHLEAAAASKDLFASTLEYLLSRGMNGSKSQLVGSVKYARSWPIVPLSKMASIQRGKFSHRPRNLPKFFGGKYPFIQVTDIAASVGDLVPATQFLSEDGVAFSRSFPPNTVLISITGAVIGKTAIARQEIWTPDSIIGIQANRNVHPEFIELVLRRLHPLLNGSLATKSTTQKNINLETLRPLLVPCPGLDEQRNIASVLYKIQSRTALHASRAQLAQSVAQAVLTQTDQFGGNGHV